MPLAEAGPDDLAAIFAFVNHAYRGASAREGWTHEADLLDGQRTDSDLLAAMLVPPSTILVDRDADGAIRACVHASIRRQGVAYLGMLAVDPARQGGGVGRAIVDAVETRARAAAARRSS